MQVDGMDDYTKQLYREHTPRRAHPKYIHLRTPRAIDLCNDALAALSAGSIDEVEWLTYKDEDDFITWENGLVLRIYNSLSCSEIAKKISSGLSLFDDWAIHDGRRDFIEKHSNGLLKRYFDSLPSGKNYNRNSAILFIFSNKERAELHSAMENLRQILSPNCLPVMHYRDGRILMLPDANAVAPGIIKNRLSNTKHGVTSYVVVGDYGVTVSSDNRHELSWEPEYLAALQFGSDSE